MRAAKNLGDISGRKRCSKINPSITISCTTFQKLEHNLGIIKGVQSKKYRQIPNRYHYSTGIYPLTICDVTDAVLMYLMLTLNRFRSLFCCCHCLLLVSKCRLRVELLQSKITAKYQKLQFAKTSVLRKSLKGIRQTKIVISVNGEKSKALAKLLHLRQGFVESFPTFLFSLFQFSNYCYPIVNPCND